MVGGRRLLYSGGRGPLRDVVMLKKLKRFLSGLTPTAASPQDGGAPAERVRTPVHRGPKIIHQPIPEDEIDPDALKIVRRLTRFDHTAYLVGGCVRDLLLGRRPKDFDVGTSATPRQVKRLFRNCRIIGRRFRLAHIYFQNGKIIEVATFRARNLEENGDDAGQERGEGLLIRDDNVFGTPEEDALRRDFTINALFYDVNEGNIIDHADGLEDLRHRVIRTIGDPEVRFREDPIRILRAIKFAARLDFEIEPKTLQALRRTRNLVPKAAPPRILEEINRFAQGGAARRSFELLRETGVFEVILPELAEGYADDPHAWALLLDLLEALDARVRDGHEVRLGEVFAVLLLPLLAQRMGWHRDGTVERPKGFRVRDAVDHYLRPIALRLRVPRREQELCRQIVATLYRMVPSKGLGRAARESILRRPCLDACLWMLERLAAERAGVYRDAYDRWAAWAADARPAARREQPKRRRRTSRAGSGDRAASTRRRPRGGGREESKAARARPERPALKADLPPPWDDDYFFAALPSVPADTATGPTDDAAAEGEGEETPTPAATAEGTRRRRRRRGRRRRRPAGESPSGEAGNPTGEPEGS